MSASCNNAGAHIERFAIADCSTVGGTTLDTVKQLFQPTEEINKNLQCKRHTRECCIASAKMDHSWSSKVLIQPKSILQQSSPLASCHPLKMISQPHMSKLVQPQALQNVLSTCHPLHVC